MRTDIEIQKDVIIGLQDEPFLNAAEIGVAVRNGIVTLTGGVAVLAQKLSAEKVAWKTNGVRAIAVAVRVGETAANDKTDEEIADAVASALTWHTVMQEHKLRIKVEQGVVSLKGEVDFGYQRTAAVDAVRNIVGDSRVNDCLSIRPALTAADVQQKIRENLAACNPCVDLSMITPELSGSTVVLRGAVYSGSEKDQVETAARAIPGITAIDNKIVLIKEQQISQGNP